MENQIHKILNKFRPAFGLLRTFRGTLPAGIAKDVESGRPDPMRFQSQDDTTEEIHNASQLSDAGSLRARQEDSVRASAAITNSDDGHVENESPQKPQFTEGPSRFILANDGSRDCVALLVNESFLAKLRDIFREKRDIDSLDGSLYHAKEGAKYIENLVQGAQESLETAESQEQANEYEHLIKTQSSELFNVQRRREELEKERELVNDNLEISRSHTEWVLKTAMSEADLLGPELPLPAILLRGEEIECSAEEVVGTGHTVPAQSSEASVESDHEEAEPSDGERQRRAAYDDFVNCLQFMNTVQDDFDDRQNNYRENLAKFQQKDEAGTGNMSRSEFDRRSVQYGQEVTRALIDAEEALEEARERAQALGAIGSDHGHEFNWGPDYEESWPENKVAEHNASCDWTFVDSWMDTIPDSTSQADADSVEIDQWDAEEVDVNDSISNLDREEYRQDIERYRRICARLEDPCPIARWLGQPDANPLERRYSCWM